MPRGAPPNNNVNKRDKKFYVRVARTERAAAISIGWGMPISAVYDGRWGLLNRAFDDPLVDTVVSVVLGRVINRAEPLSLWRRVVVTRSEFSVLLWLSGSAPPPHRLLRNLRKVVRKVLEEEGRVDVEEAHRRIYERLSETLDKLP